MNRVDRIFCGEMRFFGFYLRQLRVLAGQNCSAFCSELQSDGFAEVFLGGLETLISSPRSLTTVISVKSRPFAPLHHCTTPLHCWLM
jgi:hypothetical protein